MEFNTELIKGSTKNLLLAILAAEPMYGYQIIKALREKSDDLLQFGEGTIYPVLHQLEKDKLLSSEWRKESQFPERKYYAITPKGQRQLKTSLKEWKSFTKTVNQIYAAI